MFGERLKKLRKDKKLTIRQVAEACGSSVSYISEVERGIKNPGVDLVLSLKRTFGVSTDWLLTGEEESAPMHLYEETAEYNVVPLATPEEQEYLEKLLRVMRNPLTKKAIQENLNAFLLVEKPGPLDEEKKKGGKAS